MAPRFAKQPDWTHAVLAGERPSTRAVYGVLLAWRPWNRDAEGRPCTVASPARSVIADQAGVTERMVRYATARLVELGLIRKRHQGRGRAQHYFLAWDAPFAADADPVLIMAAARAGASVDDSHEKGKKGKWEPVDDREKGKPIAPFRPEKGKPVSPHRESSSERTLPPVLPRSLPTAREDVESNDGGSENQTNHNDPAPAAEPLAAELAESVERISERVAARIGRGGVWPRHPRFRGRLRVWMEAGWTRDHLVELFVSKTELELVHDPAAVVASILSGEPPTAPYAPDRYRPLAFHAKREAAALAAKQRNGAENGTAAAPVPIGSRTTPVDAITAMVGAVLRGERSEDVLDPVEPRTRDLAATGSEG